MTSDPWAFLRSLTHARIALGRSGHSVPTRELLDFRLAHSRARDSVWREVDFAALRQGLGDTAEQEDGEAKFPSLVEVQSRCGSKQEFLLNPGLGRVLSSESALKLSSACATSPVARPDCVLVVADGLSAEAVHVNALDFAMNFIAGMRAVNLSLGPVVLARYARVALGDATGVALNARSVLVLIGERPGLASSDSLSVYFTHAPDASRSDANRNCISNIHGSGLDPLIAARMAVHLAQTSIQRQLSGVDLKVEYDGIQLLQASSGVGNS